MDTNVLEELDVQSVEQWLATPEAEKFAEMDLLSDMLTSNAMHGGASW